MFQQNGDDKPARRGARWPEYSVWAAMVQRCGNPNDKSFPDYGGRGIKVCDPWRTFSGFLAHMGRRPTPKHTLERLNNDEGYSPDNCVWATRDAQNRNSRHNILITIDGKTMCLREWARLSDVRYTTIYMRIRQGVPPLAAIFTPPRVRKRNPSIAVEKK